MTAVFYVSAAIAVISTLLVITRLNAVHALVYLIISLLAVAVVFYTLGAPFAAALEVIIYAGAIMVLFLFVIMMLRVEKAEKGGFPLRQWGPAIFLGLMFLLLAALMVSNDPESRITLHTAMAMPKAFGRFVLSRYWLAIEIISVLLLLGLLAAIQVGRRRGEEEDK